MMFLLQPTELADELTNLSHRFGLVSFLVISVQPSGNFVEKISDDGEVCVSKVIEEFVFGR